MRNIKFITAGLLLWAIAPLPYAYYTLLRWVVTASAILFAVQSYNQASIGWAFGFGTIALLFNPIVPFYMDKESWMVFDVIAAVVFGVNAIKSKD